MYEGWSWSRLHPAIKCKFAGTTDGVGIHILYADTNRMKRVFTDKTSVSGLAGKRAATASAEDASCTDGLRSITSQKGIIYVDQAFKEGSLEHGEEELEETDESSCDMW